MTSTLQPTKFSDNLYCIDTGYRLPEMTALYVLKTPRNNLILFDTGVASSVDVCMQQIKMIGWQPQNVTAIFLTHAHLDHAGGVAKIANNSKKITVYGHKDALHHLCSPSKLEMGVRQVYGNKFFDETYAPLNALQNTLCQVVEDGSTVIIDEIIIETIYTPGHAWHHNAYCIPQEDSIIAGDAFGQSYSSFVEAHNRLIFPATPPSQFNPQAMLKSIDKILNTKLKHALITHYGAIANSIQLADQLKRLIHQYLELGAKYYGENSETELVQKWLKLFYTETQRLKLPTNRK